MHGGVLLRGRCYEVYRSGHSPTAALPPTKRVYCGRPTVRANGLWNRECGPPHACTHRDPTTDRLVFTDAFATLTLVNGRWSNPQVWCPNNTRPGIDQTALREQAIRLLPAVAIGSAWKNVALVNAETILWAATRTARPLPSASLAGQQIALRIRFVSAHWDYGDGTRQTIATPGKPYDSADPCHTAQCPHYFGHTYARTGSMTITLTITWHAQYRTTGPWIDIPDDITGSPSRHTVVVKQARAVLVPNPGER